MAGVMMSIRSLCLCAAALTAVAALSATAQAEDASPWAVDIRSASRLIAASAAQGATQLRAGVELRMDPGWHTYWRYPGDSGVPPTFNFSDSDNVSAVTVLYPAPHRFSDESGTNIGYLDHVIFPVVVTPRDPAKPVNLRLDLQYAVCDKLCVPSAGQFELTLAGSSDFDTAIARAEASVPKHVTPKDAGLTVRRVSEGPKPMVAVDVATKADVEVFAEGPTPEWALPIPKPEKGAPPGHRRFAFELDGLPVGADPKAPVALTFTIVGGAQPLETTAHLD
jgi:DsbC/DsbD-like thiol-disulfide interchange protein